MLNSVHYEKTKHAGTKFIVHPRVSNALIDCAKTVPSLFFLEALTPNKRMKALYKNYSYLTFFFIKEAGRNSLCQALSSPFSEI
ncbi:2-dehydro-3-deoxyphosphogluconate aldolase [Bartonella raoultii]|uniref:2-dehydro-3-deoxyphosphogluconate aldolase n=1 Tax=Bartonella raoultii TaxID=1457020 RepID=UPI003530EA33